LLKQNSHFEGLTFWTGSQDEFERIFLVGDEGYETAKQLLKDLTKVFDTSIVSIWSLDQAQINAYKAQINWYESQTQWSYSSYLSFKSQVITFLNTYQNNEKSAEENLKLLENEINILEKSKNISNTDFDTTLKNNTLSYEKAEIDAEKNIKNLEISLKNAQLVYQNAKDIRSVTLKKMNNNIKLSQNTSSQAYKEYAKLSLKSSIYGVITDIMVDTGQDVEVTWEAQWSLKTYSWGLLTNYAVDLWKVWWDKIEITSKLQKDLQIITTNISNFDDTKFELKLSSDWDKWNTNEEEK